MKSIFLPSFILLAIAGGSARAQPQMQAVEEVPRDNWASSALETLFRLGELEGMKESPIRDRPLTRYEFAVAVTRWMHRQYQNDAFGKENTKVRDIIGALGYEFAPEISALRGREPIGFINPLVAKHKATPSGDWFDVWRDTLPSIAEKRILIPRNTSPAYFLRRRAYSSQPFTVARMELNNVHGYSKIRF